jgi:hypothetical protein
MSAKLDTSGQTNFNLHTIKRDRVKLEKKKYGTLFKLNDTVVNREKEFVPR